MSESTPTAGEKNLYMPVFAFTDGIGETFLSSLGLDPVHGGELAMGGKNIRVELFRMIENSADGAEAVLEKSDAVILLIRFLDQLSLTRIKDLFHRINHETFLPKSVVLVREPKESEFKISCTYCGQKLWVRDRDSGRRGICPQCRKTFLVPTQKSFITSYLMLTDAVPVQTVTSGDPSCRNAVAALAERVYTMDEGMKSSTMRIELPPEEAT
jgi:transposase-like protein